MKVGLFSHDIALDHDTGRGHPERPARIKAVRNGIHASSAEVVDCDAPVADLDLIALVHERPYIDAIDKFCSSGGGALDADTVARPLSWEAALRSAGAGPAAVERLRSGAIDLGYVVMRPPGHHALASRAMGFCLFNNIAITARDLTNAGHKVAIVDWDVHHGNGTQDMFYHDPDVLYLSMHEFPAYPGSGWYSEVGDGGGAGMTLNIPWPTGTDGVSYRWAMDRILVPVLQRYEPDWILVSSGYDAHANDPLAGIRLVEDDYRFMAGRLTEVVPTSRILVFLEGGYDLDALTMSAAATIEGFREGSIAPEVSAPGPGAAAVIADDVFAIARQQWDIS